MCAQGRRATRLRYAPTLLSFYSSLLREFVATAQSLEYAAGSSFGRTFFTTAGIPCLIVRSMRLPRAAFVLPT